MNFIKRNKKLLVVITVFLVALVAAIQLKNILTQVVELYMVIV